MESTPSEEAEGQAIVRTLATVLERLVSANSHLAESSETPVEQTHFHAQRAPAIGVLQYLERIHKYASCSKECFILALIYIDRLIQRNNFLLTDLNVHRVVITAVLLAAKFFDDAYYNNAYYAKVGGVLVEEMNNLECQFLFKIDFSLRVVPEVFDKYSAELINHSSADQLAEITSHTDEELIRQHRKTEQEQAYLQQQQQVVAAPQAPVMQYAPPEPTVMYHNPTPVVPVESQFPIQVALQRSVTAPAAAPQVPVEYQQQQQTSLLTEQIAYPFPNLAPHVSINHQPQVAPAHHHASELDLVYHNAQPVAVAAAQDVNLTQYHPTQALHQGLAAAPQSQVYATQPELEQARYNDAFATAPNDGSQYQVAQAPMTQQPLHPRLTNYFHTGTIPATQQAQGTIQHTHHHHHHHPEITPSPPPQPPINAHGAPLAYANGELGNFPGHLTGGLAYNLTKSAPPTMAPPAAPPAYYANPADAGRDLHRSHQQQQVISSEPIAIHDPRQHVHHGHDAAGGHGWPSLMMGTSPAS